MGTEFLKLKLRYVPLCIQGWQDNSFILKITVQHTSYPILKDRSVGPVIYYSFLFLNILNFIVYEDRFPVF